MNSISSASIKLNGPADWRRWDQKLYIIAEGYNVWKFIRENGPNPRLEPEYPERRLVPIEHSNTSTQSTVQTEEDLQPESDTSYEGRLRIHSHEKKQYLSEKEGILKVRDWIMETVASRYFQSCCKRDQSLRAWYKNLQQDASAGNFMEASRIKDMYSEVMRPMKKAPKDWSAWITKWEDIMTQAEEARLAEALTLVSWFIDLMNVLKPVAPSWVQSFKMSQRPRIDSGELTFREVAKEMRLELEMQVDISRQRAARGAFASTYNQPVSDLEETPGPQGNAPAAKSPRSKKGTKRAREKAPRSGNQEDLECPACEVRGHALEKCYYAFPENSPKEFKPREHVQKRAEENLKEEDLKARVKEIRKSKRRKTNPDSGNRTESE